MVIHLQSKIREVFNTEVSVMNIYRHPTLEKQCNLVEASSTKKKAAERIVPLRNSKKGSRNLYVIHAVGGSIYPYYGILASIPDLINVYAIEFHCDLPAKTLMELAEYYAEMVIF